MRGEDKPALLGGTPVRPQGPPDWPPPDEAVLEALQAAYRDGSWGKYHGGWVEQLEERLSVYHGGSLVSTCGSGTFAVEVGLRALKVGPGDEVLLAGYDYGGNFLTVHALGARPVLVDVDPDNWNLAPEHLAAAISPATRAILVSHLHSGVVPMQEVLTVAETHGLRVLEDAAQAAGAIIQGRRAGTWGDVGVLSFGGSKLLSAGRGGALLTGQADVQQRARLFLHRANHICPLSEVQAAVLLPQLEKLDARNAQRSAAVHFLSERLAALPGLRPFVNRCTDAQPGYYKVGLQFDAERFGLPRERLVAAVQAEGVGLAEGFRALHVGRSPSRFRRAGSLVEAERAHQGALVLHHPILLEGPAALEEVVQAIHKVAVHRELLRDRRR